MYFSGICSCGQILKPGNEYVYDYSGRLLSGIPEIDSTYAGLVLKGAVIIQVTSQNNFKLQMRNFSFGTFNKKLLGPEDGNWRQVLLEANTTIDYQYKKMLESPVEVQFHKGRVSTIKFSNQELQWSVNMKKALISSLKVHLPERHVWTSKKMKRTKKPRFGLG